MIRRPRAAPAARHGRPRPAAPAPRLAARRRGASEKPPLVAFTAASGRSSARSRPISTRSRARCDSSACLAPKARATSSVARSTSAGQASASARTSANSTGRVASETVALACAGHVPAGVHHQRRRTRTAPRPRRAAAAFRAAPISRRRGRVQRPGPRRAPRRRAPGCRPSRAASPGAVRAPSGAAARAQPAEREPATTSVMGRRASGRQRRGIEPGQRRSASSRRPISSRRRAARCACMGGVDAIAMRLERRPRRV